MCSSPCRKEAAKSIKEKSKQRKKPGERLIASVTQTLELCDASVSPGRKTICGGNKHFKITIPYKCE